MSHHEKGMKDAKGGAMKGATPTKKAAPVTKKK